MMGRKVVLNGPPMRILSLVPSQTELLYDLGVADRIAGQTVFCIYPEQFFKGAVKVGGTKKVRYEAIEALQPDLVICNKEENTEEIVSRLSEKYPVWVSDIKNIEDACEMITAIGDIVDRQAEASGIAESIRKSFSSPIGATKKSCIYLIWKDPYMAAGADTFIDEMLGRAGFINLLPDNSRYPELDIIDIVALNPEVVLLSSEPYPFTEKHISELEPALPNARIMLVNGEFFSWYGSRLVNSQAYFNTLRTSADV